MAIYSSVLLLRNTNHTAGVKFAFSCQADTHAAPRFFIAYSARQNVAMRPYLALRFARKLFCRGHTHPVFGAQLGNEHGTSTR